MPANIARKDFQGTILKIERAHHHIAELEGVVRRHRAENIRALNPKLYQNRRKLRGFGRPVPKYAPLVVGDAIHNLRTALDHCYCALVEANGGTINSRTRFPFHGDRKSAEAALKGQKDAFLPSKAVIACILDDIKPFKDGGNDLYGIHRLDIADKHHILIATEVETRIGELQIVREHGTRGGTWRNFSFVTKHDMPLSAIGFPPGLGAILKDDPKTTFDIRFAEGTPFEGESILHTLKRFERLVSDTIVLLSRL